MLALSPSSKIIAALPAHPARLAATAMNDKDIFGHPRGLFYLAGTEFWERVSFHGMQALLTRTWSSSCCCRVTSSGSSGLLRSAQGIEWFTGPLATQALAFQIFGLYIGAVYMSPLLGGVLGDRLLGRRRTVTLGALMMTLCHFCMAFDASFLLAMLLLTVGAGCLRANLMAQVGTLYSPEDRRRADAFQIYYSSINAGAFVAPIVTGARQGLRLALRVRLRGLRHADRVDRVPALAALPSAAAGPCHRPATHATRRPRATRDCRADCVDTLGCAVLGCADAGLERLQRVGARSRQPQHRGLDDAGAVAAVDRRSRAARVDAARIDVLALAGRARSRAG